MAPVPSLLQLFAPKAELPIHSRVRKVRWFRDNCHVCGFSPTSLDGYGKSPGDCHHPGCMYFDPAPPKWPDEVEFNPLAKLNDEDMARMMMAGWVPDGLGGWIANISDHTREIW